MRTRHREYGNENERIDEKLARNKKITQRIKSLIEKAEMEANKEKNDPSDTDSSCYLSENESESESELSETDESIDLMSDSSEEEEEEYFEKETEIARLLQNLTKQERGIYEKDVRKIWEDILSERPDIKKIINSNMTYKQKCEAVEKLNILYNMDPNSLDYLELKRQINHYIKEMSPKDLTESQIEDFHAKEKELDSQDCISRMQSLKFSIISNKDIDDENKRALWKYYRALIKLDKASEEFQKRDIWFNFALSLPFQKSTKLQITHELDLIQQNESFDAETKLQERTKLLQRYYTGIYSQLNNRLYKLHDVKEQMIVCLNNYIVHYDKPKTHCIALVGPPGCGKTDLVETIAKITGMPYYKISLGGAKDYHDIKGHDYTYLGSSFGEIARALMKMGSKKGILFFDEFEKVSFSYKSSEIHNALIEVFDSILSNYRDLYFHDLEIDLSEIWFIVAVNSVEDIIRPLYERLGTVIRLPGYNFKEKCEIVKNFLLPRELKEFDLEESSVTIDDAGVSYLIEKIKEPRTEDKGVRVVKNAIKTMVGRISFLVDVNVDSKIETDLPLSFNLPNLTFPLKLTPDIIDKLLVKTEKQEDYLQMLFL